MIMLFIRINGNHRIESDIPRRKDQHEQELFLSFHSSQRTVFAVRGDQWKEKGVGGFEWFGRTEGLPCIYRLDRENNKNG